MAPAMYSSAQLRILQRRVKVWRSNRARELVTRILGDADAMRAGAATQRQPSSQNKRTVTNTRE
ncbi:integrase catalytic region [Paraburkholderia hospita]|uniref:Integrase catalytic region n=1 Tax=Paraburkholderia hospita TaxID=169430 RepID=A0ABP2PF68_9BURK|nr:integrase catalytic region [Paraburkholderia hospita]